MSPAVAVGETSFHRAWEEALGALELDVRAAEQMLALARAGDELDPDSTGSWAPPAGIGPLPESLQQRARIVLARQLAVAEQIVSTAVHSQQQLRLRQRLGPVHEPSRPLFVDAAF